MNWHTVGVLLAHELRMLLRDRRTVVLAIALPLVTIPLILFASKTMSERQGAHAARDDDTATPSPARTRHGSAP